MRDEKEERKKQARSNKQTRQSLFLRKMSCLGWDSNPCMYMYNIGAVVTSEEVELADVALGIAQVLGRCGERCKYHTYSKDTCTDVLYRGGDPRISPPWIFLAI